MARIGGTGNPLPTEKVEEIRRLRAEGMSYAAIGRTVGVSDVTAARYCGGIEKKKREQPEPEPTIKCPACGEELPQRAKFCFMCGTKIMTKREKLALRVSTIRSVYDLLPDDRRDEFMSVMNDVLAFLDNKEEPEDES